jgi:lysophospholipase L1-like esterase
MENSMRNILSMIMVLALGAPAFGATVPRSCQALIGPPSSSNTPHAETYSGWIAHYQALRVEASAAQPDLLLVGDSIFGRWPEPLRNRAFPGLKTFDIGVDGDRTDDVLYRMQYGNLPAKAPRYVAVLIGTNNIGEKEMSAEEIAGGIAAVVTYLRETLPQSRIVLFGILPRGDESAGIDKRLMLQRANALVARCGDGQSVVYTDVRGEFLAPDGSIPASLMPDQLHPSERGYSILADAIKVAITRFSP